MGDIAEMMLDGTLDSESGEYIGTGKGFPRSFTCHTQYTKYKKNHKRGVVIYLLKLFPDMPKSNHYDFCFDFVKKTLKLEDLTKNGASWKLLAESIQDNWQRFVSYCKEIK